MSVGLVDTTVIIHLFRKTPAAIAWRNSLTDRLSVTPITWAEILNGSDSKIKLETGQAILGQFEMIYLIRADMVWALKQL